MSDSNPDQGASLSHRVGSVIDDLEAVLQSRLRRVRGQLADLVVPLRSESEDLRLSLAAIDHADGQSTVLEALLEETRRRASRAALFLVEQNGFRVWSAVGFESIADGVESFLPAGPWSEALKLGRTRSFSAATGSGLADALGVERPAEGLLVPLVLRGRVAALLYADRTASTTELRGEEIRILCHCAAQALDLLPLREGTASALADDPPETEPAVASGATVVPAEESEAPAAPEVEPSAEDEAGAAESQGLPDPYAADGDVPDVDDDDAAIDEAAPPQDATVTEAEEPWSTDAEAEPDAEPEPDAEAEPEEVREATAHDDLRAFAGDRSESTEPSASVIESADPSETAMGLHSAEDLGADVTAPEPSPPAEESESDEVESAERSDSSAVEPAAAPTEITDTGSLVMPPGDLVGPGSAFRLEETKATSDPDQAALDLARLLVSEIQLYNRDRLEEARRQAAVYPMLEDDIERAREIYEQRVEETVRQRTGYFDDEIVRVLANGDSALLGR